MPFAVSVSPLTRGFAYTPRTAGGFSRAARPDPNDAMDAYARTHGGPQPVGAQAGGGPAASALPPSVTASGESALSANLGLLQRAHDTRQASDMGEGERRAEAGNTGLAAVAPLALRPMDPRMDALLQALSERGTTKLATTASWRHATDAPGFFDNQNPEAQDQQARADYLRRSDVDRLMDAMRVAQTGRR